MTAFNAFTSAIFGTILAPFGAQRTWSAWVDVLIWSVLGGILALRSGRRRNPLTVLQRHTGAHGQSA